MESQKEGPAIASFDMRCDRLEKLNVWFKEQLAVLKAEGASEQELEQPAVADLALRKIFEEHFDQLRGDEEFIKEAFAMVSDKTSPDHLRGIGTQAQKEGNAEFGRYLELIADHRDQFIPAVRH